ncbi:MAG TPA: YfiR family protein [Burkholderiaceae bacterium]|nr:YfiR family protein [Burkholderiaceae bacterium]
MNSVMLWRSAGLASNRSLAHCLLRILLVGLWALLLNAALAQTCLGQSQAETLEYRIKAAFLCKFAHYVEWPAQAFAQPDSPIVIGVVAQDAVADEIARTAASLSVDGRPLKVRRLHPGDSVADVHLIYVASSENSRLAETLAAAKGHPVLIVTESSQAIALGSMINFVVVDDKVRFDISPHSAESSRLRISARLLSVARTLITKNS